MNVIDKINKVLDKIKPYLMNDGGNIEFVKFENGVVYVKFIGACGNCPHVNETLKNGVEIALTSEVKEVKKVVKVN